MVQQQIHRELADMLLHDSVLQQAVLPESGLGADMYLSSMATISDVEISNDLQVLFKPPWMSSCLNVIMQVIMQVKNKY